MSAREPMVPTRAAGSAGGASEEMSGGGWAQGVQTGTGDITGRATRVLMWSTAVFVAWAALFPLGSAIVAEGTITATGQNKIVQHRTGGVIQEILYSDGDTVRAGEPIMILDPINEQAELTKLRGRMAVLSAMRMRLEAENEDAAGLVATAGLSLRGGRDVPPRLDPIMTASTPADPVQARLVEEQQREFQRGREALRAELDGLLARMDALEQRRAGLERRTTSSDEAVAILARQVETMRPLAAAGHIARKTLWDTEQELLSRMGELDGIRSEESALADEIAETDAKLTQARMSDQKLTSGRLTEVMAEIAQIADQIRAAETAVSAARVKAPADGTLVHMKHGTVGAVAAPGEVLAQIVPAEAELTFVARVAPADIAYVHVGQSARVRITALNARLYDDVPGEVSLVPADANLDERTGQKFFAVEVKLASGPRDRTGHRILGSGMLGEAFIDGDARTFASYLFRPISDSLGRSFREH
jgi:HlyD family type I secretion membrane fusion protein